MNKIDNLFEEVFHLTLQENESSEPFKTFYEAREKLLEFKTESQHLVDDDRMLGRVDYRLGALSLECEEYHSADFYLTSSLVFNFFICLILSTHDGVFMS